MLFRSRLAIDRVFSVRGRGTVVTGSLRGSGLIAGQTLRIEPGGRTARIREIQVHGARVHGGAGPGRTALNLAGVEAASLRRGQVLTTSPGVEVSSRLLVVLHAPAHQAGEAAREGRFPPPDGARARLHLGTSQSGVRIGRTGHEATILPDGRCTAILRLDEPIAVAAGDRFVLRRPSPALVLAGGVVLDPLPPRGVARRRISPERVARLVAAVTAANPWDARAAMVDVHGALPPTRGDAVAAILGGTLTARAPAASGDLMLSPDVRATLERAAHEVVVAHHATAPLSPGAPIAEIRPQLALELRRLAGVGGRSAAAVASALLDELVADGRLAREGDRLRDPDRRAGIPPELESAMVRLESLLAVPAPPGLGEAARAADCPPDGVRALESAGRLVRIEPDLAWAAPTWHGLAAQALAMARQGPLSPAAFRDATGTSRRYVLAILEDLDRRGILRRTPDGHLPGPKAPPSLAAAAPPAVAPRAALPPDVRSPGVAPPTADDATEPSPSPAPAPGLPPAPAPGPASPSSGAGAKP